MFVSIIVSAFLSFSIQMVLFICLHVFVSPFICVCAFICALVCFCLLVLAWGSTSVFKSVWLLSAMHVSFCLSICRCVLLCFCIWLSESFQAPTLVVSFSLRFFPWRLKVFVPGVSFGRFCSVIVIVILILEMLNSATSEKVITYGMWLRVL